MKKTNEDNREFSFEFNGKKIYYQQTTNSSVEQICTDLNENQRQFLNYYLGEAEILLKKIIGDETDLTNFTPEQLDYLICLWNNNSYLLAGIDKEMLIYSIGSAFGHYINIQLGTAWTYQRNEYGHDFICSSLLEESKPSIIFFTFYPFSFTERAIEDKRTDCLQTLIQNILQNDRLKKEK